MTKTTILLGMLLSLIIPFSTTDAQTDATTSEPIVDTAVETTEETPNVEPNDSTNISPTTDKDPFQLGPIDNTILLGDAELPEIVANLINVALSLLGIIFLVLIIYSGFLWMTSGGDEEKTKKARGTLLGAIIGLIIILMSGSIVTFLIDALSLATGAGTNTQF